MVIVVGNPNPEVVAGRDPGAVAQGRDGGVRRAAVRQLGRRSNRVHDGPADGAHAAIAAPARPPGAPPRGQPRHPNRVPAANPSAAVARSPYVRPVRYTESPVLNEVYELLAVLFETEFEDPLSAERAMTIAAALGELGEDRSWASVWWAYGAVHHDLSDEALARALELLSKVVAPDSARAAALMLRAEIKFSQAVNAGDEPNPREQVELLSEASKLAPDWPSIRVRLARALHDANRNDLAREQAEAATAFVEPSPSVDPFDTAISGRGLRPGWAHDELNALGLLPR